MFFPAKIYVFQNPENITKVKKLIAASVEQTIGEVSKKEAKQTLVKSMRKSAISLNSFAKQIDIQAQRNTAITEITSTKDWKQAKSSKRGKTIVYIRNDTADANTSALKCEAIIKGDPLKAMAMWEKEDLLQQIDPRLKKLFFVESLASIGSTVTLHTIYLILKNRK